MNIEGELFIENDWLSPKLEGDDLLYRVELDNRIEKVGSGGWELGKKLWLNNSMKKLVMRINIVRFSVRLLVLNWISLVLEVRNCYELVWIKPDS